MEGNNRQRIRKSLPSRFLEDSRMGSNANKIGNEKQIIEGFLDRLSPDHKINFIMNENDPPDATIMTNSNKIGLELTSFFADQGKKGSKGNELFECWRILAKKINSKLVELNLSTWFGAIHFRDSFCSSLDGLDRDRFLEEIIELAKHHLGATINERVSLRPESSTYLFEVVDHVSCFNAYPLENPLWWHSSLQSGTLGDVVQQGDVFFMSGDAFVSESICNQVMNICQKKEQLYQNQRKLNGAELWLLIFARGSHLNEQALITWPYSHRHKQDALLMESKTLSKLKLNAIKRVFLWNYRTETIWEIYPKPQVLFHYDKNDFILRINKIPEILQAH